MDFCFWSIKLYDRNQGTPLEAFFRLNNKDIRHLFLSIFLMEL